MAQLVSVIVVLAAALIVMAVRLRRDQAPVRSAPISDLTEIRRGVGMANGTYLFAWRTINSAARTAVANAQAVRGIVDVIPPPAQAKVAAEPSFVYKATTPKWWYGTPIEILIVGSHHTAPYGEVRWLPWFWRELNKFLPQRKRATFFVENENLEWTSNVFSKVEELVKQAEVIKSHKSSPESDVAKMDWIKKYNHKNRVVGLPVNEDLTSANFSTLVETLNREYHVFQPAATAVDVMMYNLFKQLVAASNGLLSVKFIEEITDVNKYIEMELATMGTSTLVAMPKDVQNKSSQLLPAYLSGSASTYFDVLPFVLPAMDRLRFMPERNRKRARTIHDSIQIGGGGGGRCGRRWSLSAVVVVGAENFGRAEEKTPDSILDAFESLGYDIVPVDMLKEERKERKRKSEAEAKAARAARQRQRQQFARQQRLLMPPSLSNKERERELSQRWKALSKAEKAEYVGTNHQ